MSVTVISFDALAEFILLICICSVLTSFQSFAQTKIFKGDNKYGEILYNFDGQYVRAGDSKYSERLLTISGKLPVGLVNVPNRSK